LFFRDSVDMIVSGTPEERNGVTPRSKE
jgi:hypothetical protein